MKIVHSLPSLGVSGGGPPRSVSQLCSKLVGLVNSVVLIAAYEENDPMVNIHPDIELTTLQDKKNSFWNGFSIADFGKTLQEKHEKHPITLLHQHGIWLRSSHSTTSFAGKKNIPLVLSPRGMLEPWAMQNNRLKKSIAWALYQKSDLKKATAFHATALSEAESIRRLGFKQPIAVIPNGVELTSSMSCIGSEQLSSAQKPGRKTALFLSRIHPKKGLPMLLDAWKAVGPKDWDLIIAGNDDGGHVQSLLTKIEALGLSQQVKYVGSIYGEAKLEAYQNADLFILPSFSENFGIVVAEALSYKLPVLTTKGCPWQELETENCGWWVDPTPKGIESGLINAFSTSDSRLVSMGESGQKLIKKNYQWKGIAERMLAFYSWLLSGGEKPKFVL